MAAGGDEVAPLTLRQSDYEKELVTIAARLEGPVCQIGARAQIIDAKQRS